MEPSLIYRDFMQCEDRSGRLYLDFSVRFYEQIDISWFWIEMAMEEKQHAGLLYRCLDESLFAEQLPSMATIIELKQLLQKLEKNATNPVLNIDDAFDIAIQIETCEMEEICQRLTAPIVGPPQVVQKRVNLSASKHFGKLRSAAERFAVSKTVMARFDGRV